MVCCTESTKAAFTQQQLCRKVFLVDFYQYHPSSQVGQLAQNVSYQPLPVPLAAGGWSNSKLVDMEDMIKQLVKDVS